MAKVARMHSLRLGKALQGRYNVIMGRDLTLPLDLRWPGMHRGKEERKNRWRENGFYVMLGEDERWVKKKKDMLHQVKEHKKTQRKSSAKQRTNSVILCGEEMDTEHTKYPSETKTVICMSKQHKQAVCCVCVCIHVHVCLSAMPNICIRLPVSAF